MKSMGFRAYQSRFSRVEVFGESSVNLNSAGQEDMAKGPAKTENTTPAPIETGAGVSPWQPGAQGVNVSYVTTR